MVASRDLSGTFLVAVIISSALNPLSFIVTVILLRAHSILPGFSLVDQANSGSGKSKKGSTQQSNRPGDSNTDRHQRAASSRSQPLNLSQVTAFQCR